MTLVFKFLLPIAIGLAPLACGGDDEADCAGTVVDTEAECLQDVSCTELPSGKFCSGGETEGCWSGWVQTETCPAEPVFWCRSYSESRSCELGDLTEEQCTAADGDLVSEPEDGSALAAGCPNERTVLGFIVPGGRAEGTLCCER